MSVYNKYKLRHNVFVAHCYGAIHTLRLLDFVYSKEKTIQGVAAVVILDLGATAPVNLGLVGKLPAFVLGRCVLVLCVCVCVCVCVCKRMCNVSFSTNFRFNCCDGIPSCKSA